jgi:acetyl-CoA carboxylase biotin carboxyl carrier protein
MSKDAHRQDSALVRELADILSETGLTEIEVERGDLRVRVVREPAPIMASVASASAPAHAPSALPAASAPVSVATPAPEAAPVNAITSPMVGTAYLSPEPGAAAFITVGAKVSSGDTLLLIEAMKTFNPIKADKSGTVKRILIDDGSPVEYGQPLIVIE